MGTIVIIGCVVGLVLPWIIVGLWPRQIKTLRPPPVVSDRSHVVSITPKADSDLMQTWMRDDISWLCDNLPSHAERRRMRMQENGGSHTKEEWADLCRQFNMRCARCGRKRRLTKDHVTPVVHGGSDSIDNLQPLCKSCNCQKHDRFADYRSKRR